MSSKKVQELPDYPGVQFIFDNPLNKIAPGKNCFVFVQAQEEEAITNYPEKVIKIQAETTVNGQTVIVINMKKNPTPQILNKMLIDKLIPNQFHLTFLVGQKFFDVENPSNKSEYYKGQQNFEMLQKWYDGINNIVPANKLESPFSILVVTGQEVGGSITGKYARAYMPNKSFILEQDTNVYIYHQIANNTSALRNVAMFYQQPQNQILMGVAVLAVAAALIYNSMRKKPQKK